MKIMFFVPRMGGGGAERVIANLANDFDKKEHSVLIYTPTDSKSFYPLRPSVQIIGENYPVSKKPIIRQFMLICGGARLWFAYNKTVKREKPDVVISFLTETNIIALLHNHKQIKLIISERNDPTKYSKPVQLFIKLLYKKADVLVCQSYRVADYFALNNTEVIPNPIDVSLLPKPYNGVRRKTVSAVGRLALQKNFFNMINAFSMVENDFNDYNLEIYGEGPLHNTLQELIDSLNMTGRVKLMGAHKDVLEKIKDTSLFIMSSDYEGFPNALVEAMAIGLPVISTDFNSGTAREIIGKENGVLVPVGDPEALAKAMNELLRNRELRESMSKENIKIRDKLAVDKISSEWFEKCIK